ncbi:MAG: hypothetical protein AB1765_12730 [Candidatus Hydrogenedentota bacterium]
MSKNVHDAIAFAKAFQKKVEGVDGPWDIILNPVLADDLADWGINAANEGYLSKPATELFQKLDKLETFGQALALTGVIMSWYGKITKEALRVRIGQVVSFAGGAIWSATQAVAALTAWSQMTNDLNDVSAGQDKFFWGDDTSETGLDIDYI